MASTSTSTRSQAQKNAEKRYEKKRAGKRARAWTALVYPDSAVDGWQEKLRELLVECLISPLHDKDILPDGSPKKPHWHVVLSFKNPTTYQRACEVFEEVGAVPPPEKDCKVKDFRQMARYLCHLDQPSKHQYNRHEVVSIGSIDYETLVMSCADENEALDEIFDFMDTYALETYAQVVRQIKQAHPEWKTLVYRKFSHQITNYAKSIHAEMKGL